MKFLSFILAFYVLALSINPCCADDPCAEEDICTYSEEQVNNHQEDQGCEGECSPFFTCGTCSGFIFPSSLLTLAPTAYYLIELISVDHSTFSSEFCRSIWQPPKSS